MKELPAAVLFDKDGTLIDFHRTWDRATGSALRASAPTEANLSAAADAIQFDLANDRITPGSPMVAESNDVLISLLSPHVDVDVFVGALFRASKESISPAVGADNLTVSLFEHGVSLAVVTNDWVDVVEDQLAVLRWRNRFRTVVGADSGYGAKPDPGMVEAALGAMGVQASQSIMVGDTAHDLRAGALAGVPTVLVTNGSEPADGLRELADLVVATLDELAAVLGIVQSHEM